MLHKIKNRPLWYQFWTVSVVVAAVYCLIKFFSFGLNATDHLVQVYALTSVLIDYLFLGQKS